MVAATRTAEVLVNQAVAVVRSALADPSKVSSRAAARLLSDFKIVPTDKKNLQVVLDGLQAIESGFGGGLELICDQECKQDEAGELSPFLGVIRRWGTIHLCPHWFLHFDHLERAETIIHEMAHKFAGKGDSGAGQYLTRKGKMATYAKLSIEDSLDLADTYAQFARTLPEADERTAMLEALVAQRVDPVVDAVTKGLSKDQRAKVKEVVHGAVSAGYSVGVRANLQAAGLTDSKSLDAIETALEAVQGRATRDPASALD
jgi:hypothetical protein